MLTEIRCTLATACLLSAAFTGANAQTVPPRPLPGAVPPEYPEAALREGIEGAVSYRAHVGANGVVKSVEILTVPATGYGFEDAVRRSVSAWRFVAATADGVAAEGVYESTAQFAPALHGEFVFPVTPLEAWTAIQEIARGLKLDSAAIDKRQHVLVTRPVRYRDDVYPRTETLGLAAKATVQDIQWHLAAPPGFTKARVAVATITTVRRSDGEILTNYSDAVLRYWFVSKLGERLGHTGEPLAAGPTRRSIQSPPEPPGPGSPACPTTPRPPVSPAEMKQQGFKFAKPVFQLAPVYPRRLIKASTQGTVQVRGVVTEHGTLSLAQVDSSNAPEEFKTATVAAASLWRFQPATLDGCSVMTEVTLGMTFSLR